jgi:hypothetical protein
LIFQTISIILKKIKLLLRNWRIIHFFKVFLLPATVISVKLCLCHFSKESFEHFNILNAIHIEIFELGNF